MAPHLPTRSVVIKCFKCRRNMSIVHSSFITLILLVLILSVIDSGPTQKPKVHNEGKSPYKIRLTKAICVDLPYEIAWNVTCRLKLVRNQPSKMLFRIVVDQVDQLFLTFAMFYKYHQTYQPLLMQVTFDVCSYLRKYNSMSVSSVASIGPSMDLDQTALFILNILEKNNPSAIRSGCPYRCGRNSDSSLEAKPASFKGIEKFIVDSDILFPVIAECRVIKSPAEAEVLRYVAKVSSDAHKQVMKKIRPGWHEYQGEAEFLHHAYSVGGCRHVSYTCICGAGSNSAILHYGHAGSPNDRLIKDGEMCLFDMGANYNGYAADITCSFPVNGKFTDDQKLIYNAVLAARDAVCGAAKEGVSWVDMHRLANRVMLAEMKTGGLLQGDVDDMMAAGLNAIFQPHGLGHLIGLDVHDVGGYLSHCPERPSEPGANRLRMARTLMAGMYVTIEPGCYFIDPLLNKAFADPNLSKFLVKEQIDRFRNFGGVRIEDDVLITKTGIENFTFVPRTVEEIEAWMAH